MALELLRDVLPPDACRAQTASKYLLAIAMITFLYEINSQILDYRCRRGLRCGRERDSLQRQFLTSI